MPIITPTEETRGQQVIYEHRDVERREEPERVSQREKLTAETVSGGYGFEALAGACAVVLAIISLAGYLPMLLTSIATIAIGAGLLVHGAAIGARWSDMVRGTTSEKKARFSASGGVGVELVAGAAGVVFGILALIGIAPVPLLSIAAIVFGGALLLGAPAQTVFARSAPEPDRRTERIEYNVVEGVSGTMTLVGIGAAVLGILALLGIGPRMLLIMISMLGVGGILLLGGGALMARFVRHERHAHQY